MPFGGRFQTFSQLGLAMVDAGIESQFVLNEAAFLFAPDNADEAALVTFRVVVGQSARSIFNIQKSYSQSGMRRSIHLAFRREFSVCPRRAGAESQQLQSL